MKLKSFALFFLIIILLGCEQKDKACQFISDDGLLLTLNVTQHYEANAQKVFTDSNLNVEIKSFVLNEVLDTVPNHHFKADLITNYYNSTMSQYSLASLEIYCDSIARIASKSISKDEFALLYEMIDK